MDGALSVGVEHWGWPWTRHNERCSWSVTSQVEIKGHIKQRVREGKKKYLGSRPCPRGKEEESWSCCEHASPEHHLKVIDPSISTTSR